MENLTGSGRYAEVNFDNMNISGIHSSFFSQSTYSDIRGTKGMQTEGTYLFLDFSQSNASDTIHQDNFSRSNYADIKIPLLRRHSSSSRDTRALSAYADLDFTRKMSKFSTADEKENNNNNKHPVIHGSTRQTVYSKIRPYSVEELDKQEPEIYPKLYAKVVPKSQRNCNQQTGTNIIASKSTQDIHNELSKNSTSHMVPNYDLIPEIKLELRPDKVPFRIRPIPNTQTGPSANSNFENRKKAELCNYNNLPPKVLVPIKKLPNRNPPPIRPKPLTGHNQPLPIPPHSPSSPVHQKNIPISPIGIHDNKFTRIGIQTSECLASMEIIGTTPLPRRNSIGRSQSFRGPSRTTRPDKPPPLPPVKPTFHAFHHNNPIMSPKGTQNSSGSYEKLSVTISSMRTRSQGENTFLEVRHKQEGITPPLPARHNAKAKFQQICNPPLKSLKKSHSIKPVVSMGTEKSSLDTLDYTSGTRDTKFTPMPTFPKRYLQLANRPDLPPKPKPRIIIANESTLCEGNIWKRNPKANEWSQWFAILDLFTLKLYQSKEDQPWLTIQTSKIREINKFLLEGAEFQLAFSVSTAMKTYFFTTNTNGNRIFTTSWHIANCVALRCLLFDTIYATLTSNIFVEQAKIWIKAIATAIS